MRGLLNRVIKAGVDEDVVLRPLTRFTREKITQVAERAAIEFRSRSMNLISCFGPLEGEFGVYSSLSNFVQAKNPLTQEINDAVQGGDEIELLQVLIEAMEVAFITIYEKNAFARLQLVEILPAEAIAEFLRMKRSVGTITTPSAAPVTQAQVAPAVAETPIESCVREFKEMPSQAWKAKWLNNRNNRPIADRAFEEGKI